VVYGGPALGRTEVGTHPGTSTSSASQTHPQPAIRPVYANLFCYVTRFDRVRGHLDAVFGAMGELFVPAVYLGTGIRLSECAVQTDSVSRSRATSGNVIYSGERSDQLGM